MAKLTINPAYAGKVITKDLGYTVQRIEVDKIKPSQYERIYKMGFTEIFETDGKEREYTSNEEATNSGGITPTMERVQSVEKKPRKKRSNTQPKNG